MLQAQQPDTSGVEAALRQADFLFEAAEFDSAGLLAERSVAILEWCEDLYAPALLNARHLAGHIAMEKGDFDQAGFHFRESLRIAVNFEGQKGLSTAQANNDLGLLVFNQGFLDSAMHFHQYAFQNRMRLLGAEHPKTADSHNNIANCYQLLGRPALALFHYEQVLKVRRQHDGIQDPVYASALNNAANALLSLRRLDEAIDYYRQALVIRKAAFGFLHPKTAQSIQSLGNAYFEQGNLEEARQLFIQALELYKQLYGQNHLRVADVSENLGNVCMREFDLSTALEYYQQALDIRKMSLPENHPKIAQLYAALGDAYLEKGQVADALAYLNKAQITLSNLGEEAYPSLANVLDQIGTAYRQSDRYKEALDAHQQALAVRARLWGDNHYLVAGSFTNLGNLFLEQKNYLKARYYYQKSLQLQTSEPLTTSADLSSAWSNLGRCFLEEKRLTEARACFDQAQKNAASDMQEATCFRQLGSWAESAGRYTLACEYFDKALELMDYTATEYYVADTDVLLILYFKASALLKQYKYSGESGDLKKSLATFRTAIGIFQNLLGESTGSETRRRLRFQYRGLLEEAIETALLSWELGKYNTGYLNEAFVWCEYTKNLDLMPAGSNSAYAGLPAAWEDTLVQLDQEKLRLQQMRKKRFGQYPAHHPLVQQADHEIFDCRHRRDSLLAQARQRFPDFAHRQMQVLPVDIKKTQRNLMPDQAVLSFFTSDKNLFAFFVNRDTVLAHRQTIDTVFESTIKNMGLSLLAFPFNTDKRKYIDSVYTYSSYYLYRTLWKPLVETFPMANQLIIAPDGWLHFLPFDALLYEMPSKPGLFRSYPYLLRRHTISYIYSTAMYNATFEQSSRFTFRGFLGVAPNFDNDSRGLHPLYYNKEEITKLKPLLGGINLMQQDATLTQFMRLAPQYAILHLATHGKADNVVGDNSFLAFAEIKDSINNENLKVRDLYGMKLPAELVTLSACESGIGAYRPGEGTISVARGFAYAGAKSILTTLWSINDANATQLMMQWYKRLRNGSPKATALQQTKLDFINNATHEAAFPFYWASFTLIGDTTSMPWYLQSWWHVWAITTLLSVFVLLIWWPKVLRKLKSQ